ncbi:ATP-dependent helicase [Mycoplasmoides pirum]|uniref:ATP-dependent helicase n=1 Tax=Mycoplasmoides pirum TaxID=2122 RepID=UPI000696EBB6|nr:UvrD-helicase domain-containing protein [Mycoplasmoides pirum]
MNFENWNLNDQQKKIIFSPKDKSSLIISGAGTGKTKVLVYRIIYLINKYSVNPNKILAITFSNKAKNEMQIRIQKELNNQIELPWITTFHSLCYKILKNEISVLEYSNNFSIIDDEDKKSIFNYIYQSNGLSRETLKIDKAIKYIESSKSKNINMNEFLDNYKTFYNFSYDQCELLKFVFKKYNEYLKEQNYLDFSDLLNFTYKIFKNDPQILHKWSNKFDYILIDEFQDTDDIQYYIISKLAKKNNIFAVGDPDQSIYGWRGAKPENMEIFKDDFPESVTYYLEQNYRSTQEILNVANDVILNNKGKFTKKLYSLNKKGTKPQYFEAASRDLESTWIVKKIKQLINDNQSLKYNEISILYRSNFLTRNIEQFLIENKIPYFIYGGTRFYQRMEIKDLIAYLKVINSNDSLSIARILNVPSRKISDNSILKLREYSEKHNITLYDSLKEINNIDGIFKPAIKGIINFCDIIDSIREKIRNKKIKISEILNLILSETNYEKLYTDPNDNDRLENIKELLNSIKNYELNNPEANLNDYLESIQLYTTNDEENKTNSVQLMTVHSAKGLEFKCVFILGLVENIFPSIRLSNNESVTEHKIQEERRIMYVALTRAKDQLFLSSWNGLDFNNNTQIPSRFINEINLDNIDVVNSFNLKKISNLEDNDWFNSKEKNNYQNKYYDYIPEYMLYEEIQHNKFGKGIVVNIKEKTIVVAFGSKIGTKELVKNHTSIIRKSE